MDLTTAKRMSDMRQFARDLDRLLETEELYNKIPLQEIGEELGLPFGASIGENILSGIRRLKLKLEIALEEKKV